MLLSSRSSHFHFSSSCCLLPLPRQRKQTLELESLQRSIFSDPAHTTTTTITSPGENGSDDWWTRFILCVRVLHSSVVEEGARQLSPGVAQTEPFLHQGIGEEKMGKRENGSFPGSKHSGADTKHRQRIQSSAMRVIEARYSDGENVSSERVRGKVDARKGNEGGILIVVSMRQICKKKLKQKDKRNNRNVSSTNVTV